MKVIVQVPCYNEQESLPVTLAHLPHELEGVNRIEGLVVDDGSADRGTDLITALPWRMITALPDVARAGSSS